MNSSLSLPAYLARNSGWIGLISAPTAAKLSFVVDRPARLLKVSTGGVEHPCAEIAIYISREALSPGNGWCSSGEKFSWGSAMWFIFTAPVDEKLRVSTEVGLLSKA